MGFTYILTRTNLDYKPNTFTRKIRIQEYINEKVL